MCLIYDWSSINDLRLQEKWTRHCATCHCFPVSHFSPENSYHDTYFSAGLPNDVELILQQGSQLYTTTRVHTHTAVL